MSFISVSFLVLYVVAIGLRLSIGRTSRTPLYLAALYGLSLAFYGWHVPSYLVLILLSTLTDYGAALAIDAAEINSPSRRRWLVASLAINLGLLGYFKYTGLLVETTNLIATWAGLNASLPVVEIVLPIGISFYTFQSMSYTIDVYRGHMSAERSFWRFGLYVSFFPQLVAGPIVRARDFLYQLPRRRTPHARVFMAGGYLVLRGLFLKMVVADNLGLLVDQFWSDAATPGASPLLAASMLVFFSCQLFCDFAGYSDIACGLAYPLGFRLPVNFDAPFIATSFREFWRRWHITLSEWMRDYVYVPLGGARRGSGRALSNLIIVMAVSGLWHGAHFTFLLWGVLHGLAAAAERLLGWGYPPKATGWAGRIRTLFWFIVVQAIWIISMALFRAESLPEAGTILHNILASSGATPTAPISWERIVTGWWFTLPVWLLHARVLATERIQVPAAGRVERAIYAGFMGYALLSLYAGTRSFIYFQF